MSSKIKMLVYIKIGTQMEKSQFETMSTHFSQSIFIFIQQHKLINLDQIYFTHQIFLIIFKMRRHNKSNDSNQVQMVIKSSKKEKLIEEDPGSVNLKKEDQEVERKKNFLTIFLESIGFKNEKNKKFEWPIYKKLLRYAYKQWKLFILSIFTLLISSFLTSSLPLMVGLLLDDISQSKLQQGEGTMRKLQTSHLQMLFLLLGMGITTYARVLITQNLQERIAISLRLDIFKHFISNDIYFFEKYKSGQLNSRLGNDVNQAKSAASNNITFLLRNLLTIIGNIFILMFMSWRLSLLVLVIVPIYALVTIIHNRNTKKLVRQYQDVVAQSSSHLNEVFTGIQIVKSFCGEDKQYQKYNQINQKGYGINYRKSLFLAFYMTSTVILPNIGVLLVLWYGGNLVMNGSDLTAGELTSFIMYCTQLSNNASSISNSYSNIIDGTSAVQKVFEMMGYESFVDQKRNNLPLKDIKGQIFFEDVNFRYPKGEIYVIKNLNLHIKKGQYVAFVGQSGSGKSTIVKLITRFYQVQSGNILFDNVNVKDMNVKNIREQIGFVSQDAILFSGTIQQNICYGVKDYSYEQMIQVCKKAGCMDFIDDKKLFPDGFKTTVGEKGNQLSGGQKQRISIARALMKKPKILIFDEATSALDSNSEYIVQQSIENLVSSTQKKITIIIIAHRLSTIINAHRIFVMKSGQIIQQGSHHKLLDENGYYAELVQKQLQGKMRNSSVKDTQESSESNHQ